LKRANALAGAGDCQSAIDEYIKAYELLKDPVVLFNRGECFRRVGDNDAAIDDYREFLEKVPNAPNRTDIEAKIAALEAPEPTSRESSAEAQSTAPPKTPAQPKPEPSAKAAEARPPPPPAPQSEDRPEPAIAIQRAAPAAASGTTDGSRPWVWVALSVLVVGAGVAGYLLLRPREEPPPGTALGNYRF
jgi:tetratricopeptide (TPR) repeat protein